MDSQSPNLLSASHLTDTFGPLPTAASSKATAASRKATAAREKAAAGSIEAAQNWDSLTVQGTGQTHGPRMTKDVNTGVHLANCR